MQVKAVSVAVCDVC